MLCSRFFAKWDWPSPPCHGNDPKLGHGKALCAYFLGSSKSPLHATSCGCQVGALGDSSPLKKGRTPRLACLGSHLRVHRKFANQQKRGAAIQTEGENPTVFHKRACSCSAHGVYKKITVMKQISFSEALAE